MKRSAMLFSCFLICACRGQSPVRNGDSTIGYSAVLIGLRVLGPQGEAGEGSAPINLESPDDRYRVNLRAGDTALLRIEPGNYRLSPSRNVIGGIQADLRVKAMGKKFRVPFPRDILRLDPFAAKPKKATALGMLEVQVDGAQAKIRFDSSLAARRKLLEGMIAKMMDPQASAEERESAISWTSALEQSLVRVQAEEQTSAPSYKSSP